MRGAEEGEGEILTEEIDAVAEDVEGTARVHGASDFFEEDGLGILAVVVGDDFPFGRLRFADEREEDGGIEGEGAVEVLGVGLCVAVVGEVVLDGFFELDFAVVDMRGPRVAFLSSGLLVLPGGAPRPWRSCASQKCAPWGSP